LLDNLFELCFCIARPLLFLKTIQF
jgi:hypothetical protein